MRTRIALLAFGLPLLLPALRAQTAVHSRPRPAPQHAPAAALSADEQAAQVVDRFTFGATPGLVRTVANEGWEQWFAQQLQPGQIADPALAKRLGNYPSLAMSPAELAVNFPDGQVIRRIAEGKQSLPADPQVAAVYQVLLARYAEKQAKDQAPDQTKDQTKDQTNNQANAPAGAKPPEIPADRPADRKADQARAAALSGAIAALPAPQRMTAVLALPVPDRAALTRGLADPLKAQLLAGTSPRDHELWALMAGGYGGNGVAASELEQAKVLRAVLSERQLEEVMTDFWLNHFNIDLSKTGDEVDYANQYEADAIRSHALGSFADLLLATAHSPAMMIYLDNLASIGPDSPAAERQRRNGAHGGLNENYGREVMELHTLGVDGGYTQADVTALANILTGWGVDKPQTGGPFLFDPRRHEPGPKQWLGHTVAENGEQEGIDALRYLAAQPATARHISFALAQRFVADAPPPALVDRMTAAWMASNGNIAEVLRTMVHSPEFFSRANFRNKVKTPLEFVASAMRATNTDPANPGALAGQLRAMGEPLYRCQPPTGYPNTGEHWMNSAALVDRLNFALALAQGKLGGMRPDTPLLVATGLLARTPPPAAPRSHTVSLPAPEPESGQAQALLLLEQALIPGEVSSQTNAVIRAQLAQRNPEADAQDPAGELNAMAAMILGSPEFQLH